MPGKSPASAGLFPFPVRFRALSCVSSRWREAACSVGGWSRGRLRGLAGNKGNFAAAPADGYKVKNVKSITQLPPTGAAGTALFTAITLLLAGAGVAVTFKSRSTSRALRA